MSDITKYPEINTFLSDLASGIVDILKEQAVGVYLFGSLTYGDFDPSRSDIDIEVVVRTPITPAELESLRSLHQNIESSYPRWSKRVECSYTPLPCSAVSNLPATGHILVRAICTLPLRTAMNG